MEIWGLQSSEGPDGTGQYGFPSFLDGALQKWCGRTELHQTTSFRIPSHKPSTYKPPSSSSTESRSINHHPTAFTGRRHIGPRSRTRISCEFIRSAGNPLSPPQPQSTPSNGISSAPQLDSIVLSFVLSLRSHPP
ncbi:uncharacterized protein DFL_002221 [Arthrobotrys flagrans]|uniref:Uncharacterized protein n=1 Tax=Arthrobotrys flagrans TaxID=97331 RepID=A0A437AA82_ARTFL|nr:hypothetical protein DFL_002221 [Arthrobotrys flagrans]